MHPVIPVSVTERSGCILLFSNGDMSIIKWIKDRLEEEDFETISSGILPRRNESPHRQACSDRGSGI